MSTFGVKYFGEFRSKYKEVYWRVEIAERGYLGSSEEMDMAGSSPLSITWEQQGDDIFVPVKGSSAQIQVMCHENFKYTSLFTSDSRKFRVSVFRNAVLFWRGYITPDLYSETFEAPPYVVSISAVDGFSLLSNQKYLDWNGAQFSGLKSGHAVIMQCLDVLDLGIDVADWVDLYALGMLESISPLKQMYVDLDRFYMVNPEPTYRDTLELFLRPLAAQIFQSSGAVHIRRAISLYNDTRPLNYYSVAGTLPSGWLVTADGRAITTAQGEILTTSSLSREVIDSMWDDDYAVRETAIQKIVPAVKSVKIDVENTILSNFVNELGFYDKSKWTNATDTLSGSSLYKILYLYGNSETYGNIMRTTPCNVEQTIYPLKLEFRAIIPSYIRESAGYTRPVLHFGIKFTNADTLDNFYLTDDGTWSSDFGYLTVDLSTVSEVSVSIEAEGFSATGSIECFIEQTNHTVAQNLNAIYMQIVDFSISLNPDDNIETPLSTTAEFNYANNKEIQISLPLSSIPTTPNAELLYSLYIVDSNGQPIEMWHTKGRSDYNSLIGHLIYCAQRYYLKPTKKLAGDIFTGKHIDLNTVLQDDKFQNVAYYVNSADLDALNDIYTSEIVEMPSLLEQYTPESGDDCVPLDSPEGQIMMAIRSGNGIALLTLDGGLYYYDCISNSLTHLLTLDDNVYLPKLWQSDKYIVVGYEGGAIVVSNQGKIIREYQNNSVSGFATLLNEHLYVMLEWDNPETLSSSSELYDVDYEKNPRLNSLTVKSINLSGVDSIALTDNTLVINESQDGNRTLMHDARLVNNMNFDEQEGVTEMLSISDYFKCYNTASNFKLAKRTSLTDDNILLTIDSRVTHADHTLDKLAYVVGRDIKIYDIYTFDETTIINADNTDDERLQNIIYVNGELYIIRENAIYKYIG